MEKIANYKEMIYKEASMINHASKRAKRVGQLLTGSKVRSLKKDIKALNNAAPTGFKESVKLGDKMFNKQKALSTEIGKVRKARTAIGGTAVAGVAGVGMAATKDKKDDINA